MSSFEASEVLDLINKNISLSSGNIFQLRKDLEQIYLKFSSNQKLRVEKQGIEDVQAFKIYAEGASDKKVILFFHSGLFTLGSTKDHLDLCGKLSSLTGFCVLSVGYRLAPENKFPAALEDCLISYLWLLKKGVDPSDIVLAGISSGGTLALSVLLYLKEKGVELPAGAVCMSPVVDLLFQGHSIVTNRGKDWITSKRLNNLRKIYSNGGDAKNPLVSPIYGDLRGLPPIMIQVGSHELLLDDIIKFHKKALNSDVEVTFELWKDMFHCFQIFSLHIEEGQNAIDSAGDYIKKILSIG
jgi:acetyl esterase/lipase